MNKMGGINCTRSFEGAGGGGGFRAVDSDSLLMKGKLVEKGFHHISGVKMSALSDLGGRVGQPGNFFREAAALRKSTEAAFCILGDQSVSQSQFSILLGARRQFMEDQFYFVAFGFLAAHLRGSYDHVNLLYMGEPGHTIPSIPPKYIYIYMLPPLEILRFLARTEVSWPDRG